MRPVLRNLCACDPCPPNHYTAAGAMDAGQCSPCAPGMGSCVDCVEGMYQDRAAQFVCHDCPGTAPPHPSTRPNGSARA